MHDSIFCSRAFLYGLHYTLILDNGGPKIFYSQAFVQSMGLKELPIAKQRSILVGIFLGFLSF